MIKAIKKAWSFIYERTITSRFIVSFYSLTAIASAAVAHFTSDMGAMTTYGGGLYSGIMQVVYILMFIGSSLCLSLQLSEIHRLELLVVKFCIYLAWFIVIFKTLSMFIFGIPLFMTACCIWLALLTLFVFLWRKSYLSNKIKLYRQKMIFEQEGGII